MEPEQKTNSFEKGTYYYFDAANWRKVLKPFFLEYEKLEERPQLPPEALQKQLHQQQLQSGNTMPQHARDVL